MAGNRPLLVILGPTASGKSALAMALARAARGEILSVDSMQVYTGMDVGTAKPTPAERSEVPHHLLDLVTPDETFSVARFVELADAAIRSAAGRGAPLIATGGTPLYYKALFDGLFDGPGADEAVRARLKPLGGDVLHDRLKRIDPAAAARIHAADHKRLVRAIEVFELTGKPISSFQTDWQSDRPPRHEAVWVGLSWDKDALNRRINARVKQMLSAGWVEEVRALLDRYPTWSKTAAEATGYAELVEHVRGRLSLDDAAERIKIATRQLARRQMKWFKRFPRVHWLPGHDPIDSLVQRVGELWKP